MNVLPEKFGAITGWRGDSLACPQAFGGDIFQGCSMGCWFCFCRELENRTYSKVYRNWKPGTVRTSDPDDFRKLFDRALGSDKPSTDWTIRCLREGVPFNMGSKAETFCYEDFRFNSVVPVLEVFRNYHYPIILETKSHFVGLKQYLDLIKEMNVAVIMAMMGGSGELISKLEPGVAPSSSRWQLVKQLNELGVWTGVRWEPVLIGINSTDNDFENFAKWCARSHAKHASVYNYRSSDTKAALMEFETRGFDYIKLLQRNETEWPERGKKLVQYLKQYKVPVSSPDFVNLGFENDCVSCCGLDQKFGLKYKLSWMYAVKLIKQNGSVHFSELADLTFKHPEHFEVMRESWNGSNKIWTLKDSPEIEVQGYDKAGFAIYGRRENTNNDNLDLI
jgi:DNA repair photolyase